MGKSKIQAKDKNDRREELLRPSPYLGYDRDKLGLHLLSRGAYKIAETQFRRASWLNPFEYRFLWHLAWCLFRQERYEEAKECIEKIDRKFVAADEELRITIEQIMSKVNE
jgi:tetratricopeptide (TPR) repeat protein